MSKELLLQQQQQEQQQQVDISPLQNEKQADEDNKIEKKMFLDLEQEIECPRCYDIMVLHSNFDRLCYFCQECNL